MALNDGPLNQLKLAKMKEKIGDLRRTAKNPKVTPINVAELLKQADDLEAKLNEIYRQQAEAEHIKPEGG